VLRRQPPATMPQPGLSSAWTAEEDQLLRNLVDRHGSSKWTLIAAEMTAQGRTCQPSSKQCRRRYKNTLSMLKIAGSWTKTEDDVLLEGHRRHGNCWTKIAKGLEGRTGADARAACTANCGVPTSCSTCSHWCHMTSVRGALVTAVAMLAASHGLDVTAARFCYNQTVVTFCRQCCEESMACAAQDARTH
jgi:Myb-like DNA-binding domain